MMATVITSMVAFAATNIDDIFVMMLLFAGADIKKSFLPTLAGRYLGTVALLAVSFLGAFGLSFLPQEYIKLLGIIPILLGIKAFWNVKKKGTDDAAEIKSGSLVWSTALITVANGADNIGIYIPLFTGYTLFEAMLTVLVFAMMTLLLCILSGRIAALSLIKNTLEKYKDIMIPIVYILLGLYILIF